MKKILHLLASAHLDPVWLWDRREGTMEAVSTCRSIAGLMKEFPELTFMRGDSWVYETLQNFDPDLFAEIQELVAQGRWELVGGGYVQNDANLPATATLLRQIRYNQAYFEKNFGRKVEVAWYADSFGQSAGLPALYQECGVKYLTFARPPRKLFPLDKPVCRWRGLGGHEMLAMRTPLDCYYGCRTGNEPVMELTLQEMERWDLENAPVFYGLGDHGGGPSRKNILDIQRWIVAHPECEVRFSTMHGYFAALEEEITRRGLVLPEVDGEINFVGRGIYSGNARFKHLFRDAESSLRRAALVTGALGAEQPSDAIWNDLAFNSFHDILPGSSIERAYRAQEHQLHSVIECAETLEFKALQQLIRKIDTTCPAVALDQPEAVPFVVFNPRPAAYRGLLELEFSPDYQPLFEYDGHPEQLPLELRDETGTLIPFQRIAPESRFQSNIPLRVRVLFEAEIPPLGWKKFTLGYVEGAGEVPPPVGKGTFCVEIDPALRCVKIFRNGTELFGGAGLRLETAADPWGPWGSFNDEPSAIRDFKTVERWVPRTPELLENGPFRLKYLIHFEGTNSAADLTVSFDTASGAVHTAWRIDWHEADRRLRLLTAPASGSVRYAVPGGELERNCSGDVPGGRYLIYPGSGASGTMGWVTDHLSAFGNYPDGFGAVVLRGNRFATSDAPGIGTESGAAVCDSGQYCFQLDFVPAAQAADAAERMELPLQILMCDRHPGTLPTVGSYGHLITEGAHLADWRNQDGKVELTLTNPSNRETAFCVELAGRAKVSGKCQASGIQTLQL